MTFVAFGTLAVVLWIGGRQVLSGSMTAGELVSFLLYTLAVAGAIGTFTGLYSQLQEALGASRRIFELLGEPVELPIADTPVRIDRRRGSVRFEDVVFTYGGESVLNRVSFALQPGETLGLLGPSGSGKSTIVNLLLRFYDPDRGRILSESSARQGQCEAAREHGNGQDPYGHLLGSHDTTFAPTTDSSRVRMIVRFDSSHR